jgi:hypothetical protein
LYEPLQYPLLFPLGTRGWGEDLITQRWTQRKYYRARLLSERRFQTFSRLGCEYICDMFSRMEDERLDFIRKGKAQQADFLRELARDHDLDSGSDDDLDGNDLGDDPDSRDRFRLPASFTGSPQYFADRTVNALALSRQRGKPDFLITATCNPACDSSVVGLSVLLHLLLPMAKPRFHRVLHHSVLKPRPLLRKPPGLHQPRSH